LAANQISKHTAGARQKHKIVQPPTDATVVQNIQSLLAPAASARLHDLVMEAAILAHK
jgi:hypothetical protein